MANRIRDLFKERGIKVASFARDNGLTASTLYAINDGTTSFEKIGISTFLKIAEGLGMTAEELYYGPEYVKERPKFDYPQQEAVNGHYESLNETGRRLVAETVEAMSSSPALRAVKDGQGSDYQTEMGA